MATEKIEDNCKILTSGYREKIEYVKPVVYHRAHCEVSTTGLEKWPCECPVVSEKRSRHVHQKGLLDQLKEYAQHVDLGAEPKAARTPPSKASPKPPANLSGFLLLDEITVEAYSLVDRVMRESGRSLTFGAQALKHMLDGLPYQCRQIEDDYPHLIEDIDHAAHSWVERARKVLGHKTSEAMFKDTVCECGGALAVGRDLQRTDVRCAGSPSAKPCGKRYGMSDWMRLYEGKS